MNKWLALVGAALLSGCSLAPEYERPLAPVPTTWPEEAAPSGSRAMTDDWRAYFTAPQLQSLIAMALEYNRDLRISLERVEEARALAGIARADRFPGVDANLQQQAAKLPGDLNTSGEPIINRRYDANLGIAAFELDFWGRVKNLDAAAQANFLASTYAQRAFYLSLVAEVATAWYSLVELEARLALSEATLKGRADNRVLIQRRRDVGLANDLDFLAADAAYQNIRAETANLARQRAAAANALRLLAGNDVAVTRADVLNAVPAVKVEMAGAVLKGKAAAADAYPDVKAGTADAVLRAPIFPTIPTVAVGLPSDVLLQRPDVLAAEQKLIAANANIGAARAAFFPKITLTVLAGVASPALSSLFGGGSGAWSFVPLLKMPLFDAGRTEAGVDLAEARKNIAVAEYEKTIQQAFREVADLLAARIHYAEQLEALKLAETAQILRLERVEARHQLGVSSYLELLEAQRDLFLTQQLVVTSQRALAVTAASLFKALGGAEDPA